MKSLNQRANEPGLPLLRLVAIGLLLTTGGAVAAVLHVDLNSANPIPPYSSWATAAVTIQDAVEAALPSDRILVTNGVYRTGGLAVAGAASGGGGSNRVAITKPVAVESVNGPQFTTIQAYDVPVTNLGVGVMRCVYLTNGASLSGFTLANGAAWAPWGAGVWCQSSNLVVVSNCVLVGGFTGTRGGGVYGGTLVNCLIVSNSTGPVSSAGGGAYGSILVNCTLIGNSSSQGGGAAYSALTNCTLTGNTANAGGGASASRMYNCLLTGNSATGAGGGGNSSYFYNCTVSGNTAGTYGGGAASGGVLLNSIVYYNTAPEGPNYWSVLSSSWCCTTPLGALGFTNEPGFVDRAGGNFRLLPGSPCVGAGSDTVLTAATDRDGRPRITGGAVDVGAYEVQPGVSGEFLGWLAAFALPTDGSADEVDADGDGHTAWQEWRADTDPTNSGSGLRLLAPAYGASSVSVRWSSVGSRRYFLERSVDLGAPPTFELIQTNIPGLSGQTSFIDTNALSAPFSAYRVGVH